MVRVLASLLLASCLVGACNAAESTAETDAKKAAATLTGDAKQAAADNPQCKLFTPAEAAQYIGEPVSPGA